MSVECIFKFYMSFGHVADCKHYIHDESRLGFSRKFLHNIQSRHLTSGGHRGPTFRRRKHFYEKYLKKWVVTFLYHIRNWLINEQWNLSYRYTYLLRIFFFPFFVFNLDNLDKNNSCYRVFFRFVTITRMKTIEDVGHIGVYLN